MADDKKVPTPAAAPTGLEAALAQLAAGQLEMAKAIAKLAEKQTVAVMTEAVPAAPEPLAEEYKGKRTYTLNAPHYRQGVRYEVGDTITVENEKPSKTWEPVGAAPKKAAPQGVVLPSVKRAADAEL